MLFVGLAQFVLAIEVGIILSHTIVYLYLIYHLWKIYSIV